MLVISTREFRANQSKYLGMAAEGEDVVLKSRGRGSFKIVPVTDSDIVISKEYILEPDEDLARAITMDELLERVRGNIHEMFKDKKRQAE